jgi:hypothetical protein
VANRTDGAEEDEAACDGTAARRKRKTATTIKIFFIIFSITDIILLWQDTD